MPKSDSVIVTAIVEDEESAYQIIKQHLERFQASQRVKFDIHYFPDGYSFLEDKGAYNLIFLDIEMPGMNGMELAKKIRAKDEKVIIIFITNMVQYAIKGYEVDALDYVLKPINYSRFEALMKKTMRILGTEESKGIFVKTNNGTMKIYLDRIYYLEILDHLLVYHTADGDYETWRSLASAEQELPSDIFARCNHSCIVNLAYVTGCNKDTVFVTDKAIAINISHSRKKEFLSKLNTYLGL